MSLDIFQITASIISNQTIIIKSLISFFLAIYILYSVVLFIQAKVLINTVTQAGFSTIFAAITFAHLTLAILLFIFVISFV